MVPRPIAWPQLELRALLHHYPPQRKGTRYPMKLTVNGELREVEAPMTVLGLIESFGFAPQKIAIELNLEIVPRSAYGEVMLKEGDRLEIVKFVGGG